MADGLWLTKLRQCPRYVDRGNILVLQLASPQRKNKKERMLERGEGRVQKTLSEWQMCSGINVWPVVPRDRDHSWGQELD